MSKLAKMAKKGLLKPDKKGKALSNLYTGKTLKTGLATGAIAAGGAASVGAILGEGTGRRVDGNDVKSFNRTGNITFNQRVRPTAPPASEKTVAPSIMAGGRQSAGAADNLGATGDMVFGMHRGR